MRSFLPSLRSPRAKVPELETIDGKVLGFGDYITALMGAGYNRRTRPWPIERAVAEGYERVVWAFAAVNAIAKNQARLPFMVVDENDDEVENHPLTRMLNEGQANPMETGRMFRHRLTAQILLSKAGAFVEVTNSRAGLPARLDLLPPGRTRIVPGTGGDLVKAFEVIRSDGSRNFLYPEQVRWFRDPHPIDAYSGTTPLEPAGLAVELDYFADMYNASFMRNDARPGGVLGVEGPMERGDMDRLEQRFGKGPHEAGKTSVIGGKLTWVDLAARPRDGAYQSMSAATKDKILTAFGVPESVLGNASGRTWDNASQEELNFWTFTMDWLLSLIVAGFHTDSDDGLKGKFDTSGIEVLQRAKKAEQDRARQDFEAGLITIDEYREVAGMDAFEVPWSRALYVAAGKTPVPTRLTDAEALGMATPTGPPTDAPTDQAALPAGDPAAADALQPGAAAPAVDAGQAPAPLPIVAGPGDQQPPTGPQPSAAPAAPAAAEQPPAPQFMAARPGALRFGKSARRPVHAKIVVIRDSKAAAPARVDPRERARLEDSVAAVLAATAARMCERTAVRVASPKVRKGTRHWEAQHEVDTRVGTGPLDAVKAVDASRWGADVEADVRPLLAGCSLAVESKAATPDAVRQVTAAAVEYASVLADRIAGADASGQGMDAITGTIRAYAATAPGWARRSAVGLVDALLTTRAAA